MLKRLLNGESHGASTEAEIAGSDQAFLRQTEPPAPLPSQARSVRTVDLFAGCGGTALGVQEACRSLGLETSVRWAIDFEAAACRVFASNFPEAEVVHGDVTEFLAAPETPNLTKIERSLQEKVGAVDLLIGGPPCQGHSDLNNFSRRNDIKNSLYLYMARAAEVFRPTHILIENVQGLPHDRTGVLERTLSSLKKCGYHTSHGLVDVSKLGVPQRRRRHIVLASRSKPVPAVDSLVSGYFCPPRNLDWAIGDLEDIRSGSIVDIPSTPSKDNRARIDYLFNNGLYDLPNEERPPCHRDKEQTYNSVYGRLRWDAPAQTITSGFYSMCMGRYVHPSRRRTLTAHEAARLQFFPDFFRFEAAGSRTALAKMIGNAVPMKLSYALVRELLK